MLSYFLRSKFRFCVTLYPFHLIINWLFFYKSIILFPCHFTFFGFWCWFLKYCLPYIQWEQRGSVIFRGVFFGTDSQLTAWLLFSQPSYLSGRAPWERVCRIGAAGQAWICGVGMGWQSLHSSFCWVFGYLSLYIPVKGCVFVLLQTKYLWVASYVPWFGYRLIICVHMLKCRVRVWIKVDKHV